MQRKTYSNFVFILSGIILAFFFAGFIYTKGQSFLVSLFVFLFIIAFYFTLIKLDWTRIKLLVGSITVLYIVFEILIYLLLCSDVIRPDVASIVSRNFGATNRPYVAYDSLTGYKYIPGKTHLVNIQSGQLVCDLNMHINQQGYCSVTDFASRKKDSTVKRLMIFGDSYAAAEVTDTTWPDLVNKLFKQQGNKTELYNFSLEAVGISNWNKIFFKEIVPEYDFDGIVLAVFGDINYFSSDLERDFAIKNSEKDWTGLYWFPELPKNAKDFKDHFDLHFNYDSNIYPDSLLNHYKALALNDTKEKRRFHLQSIKPYFLYYLSDIYGLLLRRHEFIKRYGLKDYSAGAFNDIQSVEQYYSADKWAMFKQMIDYCKAHDKEIWLVSVPSFNMAQKDPLHYNRNIYTRQLRTIALAYGCHFIDGASIIYNMPESSYQDYHLLYDSHWNRRGIDLFVPFFVQEYLRQTNDNNR